MKVCGHQETVVGGLCTGRGGFDAMIIQWNCSQHFEQMECCVTKFYQSSPISYAVWCSNTAQERVQNTRTRAFLIIRDQELLDYQVFGQWSDLKEAQLDAVTVQIKSEKLMHQAHHTCAYQQSARRSFFFFNI